MNKKEIQYTDEPLGEIREVPDFLPPPEQLVMKEKTTKVTLSLTTETLEFFKTIAEKQQTQYQKMIRALLAQYVAHYKERMR